MSKSLAELRQSPRVGLPQRSYQLCLSSSILGEYQTLLTQLEDAMLTEAAQAEGDEKVAKPKRLVSKSSAAEIREQIGALREELAEHTGTLVVRGLDEGAWRLWVDEHPAREDNERDQEVAFGCCNADALLSGLDRFAYSWNDVPLDEGDWEFIRSKAAPGDLKSVAQLVVMIHETAVDIPKLLSGSLGIPLDASV